MEVTISPLMVIIILMCKQRILTTIIQIKQRMVEITRLIAKRTIVIIKILAVASRLKIRKTVLIINRKHHFKNDRTVTILNHINRRKWVKTDRTIIAVKEKAIKNPLHTNKTLNVNNSN